MNISALSHPGLILSVQVRSQAKAPVQESARGPVDGDHQATLREAALLRVALRETGRLADQIDAIALL